MFLTPKGTDDSIIALIDEKDNIVTYGDLKVFCNRIEHEMQKGCLVLILADRTIDTIQFYYAAMSLSVVPFLVDSSSDVSIIKKYIELYRPQYIWTVGSKKRIDGENWNVIDTVGKHILIKTNYNRYSINKELAVLLTTSGTTGDPKTVRLSKKNILANAEAFKDALQLSDNEIGITTLPINYSYGMSICNMHFICAGTLLVTEKSVLTPEFHEFIKKYKPTNIHGVPFLYEMLDKIGFIENIPDSVNHVGMGGGRAKQELHEKMNTVLLEQGVRFYALYGQTEGTTLLTKLPKEVDANQFNCVGVPCLGMEAYIDAETNELCFMGSSVSMGYAYCWKDLKRGDQNNGILHTGDIAHINENGWIFITGRIKRFIKLQGIRINLDDIEKAVSDFFHCECACMGDDDIITINIVELADYDAIKQYLNRRFKISMLQMDIKSVDCIPRQKNGKIDYSSLE